MSGRDRDPMTTKPKIPLSFYNSLGSALFPELTLRSVSMPTSGQKVNIPSIITKYDNIPR